MGEVAQENEGVVLLCPGVLMLTIKLGQQSCRSSLWLLRPAVAQFKLTQGNSCQVKGK